MERIKQAIEKAKNFAPEQGGRYRRGRSGRAAPAKVDDVGEVNYSHTRVIHLNPTHLEAHRIVAFNKSNPLSVSFDLLRTQVLRKMDENGWRTLAIVSPTPECGKTVVAVNLAMSIAHHSNKTAMLVDFDLRRPKVAAYLGLPSGKSLNEVLDGEAAVSEVMVNPGLAKLVIVPTATAFPKSAETLASRKVRELVQELRDRYQERIVVLDLPPLLNTDDAIALLPQIDCALMVVGNGMVTNAEMEESLRHLHATNLLGVVLNKAEVQPSTYYY